MGHDVDDTRQKLNTTLATTQPREPNLHTLRVQLADMLELHPMMDWSPALLMGVIGILNASITAHGLQGFRQAGEPVTYQPLRLVR